jgi:uncharacterized membrane protein
MWQATNVYFICSFAAIGMFQALSTVYQRGIAFGNWHIRYYSSKSFEIVILVEATLPGQPDAIIKT